MANNVEQYYLHCCDFADALIGPFTFLQTAQRHKEFLTLRHDGDPGDIITDRYAATLTPCLRLTPLQDVEEEDCTKMELMTKREKEAFTSLRNYLLKKYRNDEPYKSQKPYSNK